MFDYLQDDYGKLCLDMAKQCRTNVGFGAVLLSKSRYAIGIGRNRRATLIDRYILTHVDYAVHAEQDAIIDALLTGYDPTGGIVYVLGMCLKGKNKGILTTRTEDIFICKKCPHAFKAFNINVMIPHVDGWHLLTAEQAMETGKRLADKGYWKEFANG